ncbi:MAG: SemiSWEET family sugar transporter [Candidatus Marisimplicoccus sp.]
MIDPMFEIIGLLAAFLTTSAFIPQVYKIYKEKKADGISLTMYVILFIGVLLWLVYGILIGSLSIIIANGITALLQLSIIIFKLKNS